MWYLLQSSLSHAEEDERREKQEARRQQHARRETPAWALYCSCEVVRSCTKEQLQPWGSGYSELFLGKKNSPQSRDPVSGKTVPLSRLERELDVPKLAWALLSQLVGLHWASLLDDVDQQVRHLTEFVGEFRRETNQQFARVIENQHWVPLKTSLFKLDTALKDAPFAGGERVVEAADNAVASIRARLQSEPTTQEVIKLHEIWTMVLTAATPWTIQPGNVHRKDTARKSIHELVRRLHEGVAPWVLYHRRDQLFRLLMAHRRLVERNQPWNDGLPIPDEPELRDEEAEVKDSRRPEAIRLLEADEDATDTVPTDLLVRLASADWEEYRRRIAEEFGAEGPDLARHLER